MARGDFLVIGLGRFGGPLAPDLVAHGYEVLGVDVDGRTVQSFARTLTHVVEADSTNAEALRQLGATASRSLASDRAGYAVLSE